MTTRARETWRKMTPHTAIVVKVLVNGHVIRREAVNGGGSSHFKLWDVGQVLLHENKLVDYLISEGFKRGTS